MSTVKKSPSKNNNTTSNNINTENNDEKSQNQNALPSTKTSTKRSHPSKIPVKKEATTTKNTESSKGKNTDTKTNAPQKVSSKTENKPSKKSPSKTKNTEKPNTKSSKNVNAKAVQKSSSKTVQKSSSKTVQKSSSKTAQKSSSKTVQKSSSKTAQKSSSKTTQNSPSKTDKKEASKSVSGTGDATRHRSPNHEEKKPPIKKGKPPAPVHIKRTVHISNFKVPPPKPNPDVNQTQPSNHIQRSTEFGQSPYSRQHRPAPPSRNKKPLRSVLSKSKMSSRVALANKNKLPGSTVKKYPSTVSFRGISSRQPSRQASRQPSRQASRQAFRQASRQAFRQTSRSPTPSPAPKSKPVPKPPPAVRSQSSIRNKTPPKLPARSYRPLRTHFVSRHKNINGTKLRNKPKFCCTLCKPKKRRRNNNGCCCNNFPSSYPCPQQNFYQTPLPLGNGTSYFSLIPSRPTSATPSRENMRSRPRKTRSKKRMEGKLSKTIRASSSKSNSSTNLKSRSSSSSSSRSRSKTKVTTPNTARYPMMMSVQPYGCYGYSAPVCYPQIPLLPLGSTRSKERMLNRTKSNSNRRLQNKGYKSSKSHSNSPSSSRTKMGRLTSKSKLGGRGEMASQAGFPYCPVSMPMPVGYCGMPNYFCPSVPLFPPQVKDTDSDSKSSSIGSRSSRKKRIRGSKYNKYKKRGLGRTASFKYKYSSNSRSRSRSKLRSKSRSKTKWNRVQKSQQGEVPLLPVSVPSYGCCGYPMAPIYCQPQPGQIPPSTADSGSDTSILRKKSKRALPFSRSTSSQKLRVKTSSSKSFYVRRVGSKKSKSRMRLSKSRSKSSSKSKENVPTGPYCLYPWFPNGAYCPYPFPNQNQNQNQNQNVPGPSKFARSDTDLLDLGKSAPFASKSTENFSSPKQKHHVKFPNLPPIDAAGNGNNNNNNNTQFPPGFYPPNPNLNFPNGGPSQGQGLAGAAPFPFMMPPGGAFPQTCGSCGPKGRCRALESIRLKYPIGPPPLGCSGFGYMPDPGCMILPWTCNGQPAQICCKKNPKVRRECPWYCNHLRHRIRDTQRKNPYKIRFDPCLFCPTWDCFHFS